MAKPRLLLLDEPYGPLDREAAAALSSLLADARDDGAAVLMSCHRRCARFGARCASCVWTEAAWCLDARHPMARHLAARLRSRGAPDPHDARFPVAGALASASRAHVLAAPGVSCRNPIRRWIATRATRVYQLYVAGGAAHMRGAVMVRASGCRGENVCRRRFAAGYRGGFRRSLLWRFAVFRALVGARPCAARLCVFRIPTSPMWLRARFRRALS